VDAEMIEESKYIFYRGRLQGLRLVRGKESEEGIDLAFQPSYISDNFLLPVTTVSI
jgi:hypothetical protein